MMSNEGKTRWSWGTGTMSGLAGQLSRAIGMHVVDNTGIADKFVYVFEFQRGQDALDTEGFVRTALDEQLGLKLEKTKGQRGFVLPIREVDKFGGQLVDGDVVDVLWTRQFEIITSIVGPDGKPQQLTRNFPTTKKVLDNIKVVRVIHLAAGGAKKKSTNSTVDTTPQQSGSGADAATQQAAAAQAAQALYGTTVETPFSAALILGITDQQAEVIKYARETGIVNLTLRAQGDTDVERTTGITDKIMTEDYGVVLPEIIFK